MIYIFHNKQSKINIITFEASLISNIYASCSVVSSSSRIGSLLAPQINMLRSLVWGPLPYLIFSGASLVSCVFTFFLPDTSSLNYKL